MSIDRSRDESETDRGRVVVGEERDIHRLWCGVAGEGTVTELSQIIAAASGHLQRLLYTVTVDGWYRNAWVDQHLGPSVAG